MRGYSVTPHESLTEGSLSYYDPWAEMLIYAAAGEQLAFTGQENAQDRLTPATLTAEELFFVRPIDPADSITFNGGNEIRFIDTAPHVGKIVVGTYMEIGGYKPMPETPRLKLRALEADLSFSPSGVWIGMQHATLDSLFVVADTNGELTAGPRFLPGDIFAGR